VYAARTTANQTRNDRRRKAAWNGAYVPRKGSEGCGSSREAAGVKRSPAEPGGAPPHAPEKIPQSRGYVRFARCPKRARINYPKRFRIMRAVKIVAGHIKKGLDAPPPHFVYNILGVGRYGCGLCFLIAFVYNVLGVSGQSGERNSDDN
jgi:hypothetical protein